MKKKPELQLLDPYEDPPHPYCNCEKGGVLRGYKHTKDCPAYDPMPRIIMYKNRKMI